MTNISNLRGAISLNAEVVKVVRDTDAAIVEAINKARAAGIPQGMLTGMLHGYALGETARMINAAD